MRKTVGIVDYGAGNLFSAIRGLNYAGFLVKILSKPEEIIKSDYVVIPGVGAFGDGIQNLKHRQIFNSIIEFVKSGRPLLGICLGSQLLHTSSTEFGFNKGLDLIKGEVIKLPGNEKLPIPHVGSAKLSLSASANKSILSLVSKNDYFYFSHSYYCDTFSDKNILARFHYGKQKLVAAVKKDNIIGCQFHPELSSLSGIKILKNFYNL